MTARSWWDSLKAKPGLVGAVRRQWPWLIMIGVICAGIIVIATEHWRRGSMLIGIALLIGGMFRWVLKDPGILAIRKHKWIDLLFYFGIGLGIAIVCITVPPSSG